MSSTIAEVSANGRYVRYDRKVGEGSSKRVWKAFDKDEGRIVAWNVARCDNSKSDVYQMIVHEVSILDSLDHPHILRLHNHWQSMQIHDQSKTSHRLCFITDYMSNGTLRDFMSEVGLVNLYVIKHWCRQILSALVYMHSQSPVIVHRDLKCDNIFIDGSTGLVKIGDFGLSGLKSHNQPYLTEMLGTPEFMAPEIYDEVYDEKVDIYAFGMCFLEMVTNRYPYEECRNQPIMVWKAIQNKQEPQILKLIKDTEIAEIIRLCLQPKATRPSAQALLDHIFFKVPNVADQVMVELLSAVPDVQLTVKVPLPSPVIHQPQIQSIVVSETRSSVSETRSSVSETMDKPKAFLNVKNLLVV